VTAQEFLDRVSAGGFLEWAEFLGNLYGTPLVDPPRGLDVLLEIDVAGATQVVRREPSATVVLLVPPSTEIQRSRLLARGDDPGEVRRRVEKGVEEIRLGRRLAGDNVVVNDEIDRAVGAVEAIVLRTRATRRGGARSPEGGGPAEDA
jgi:guanylate kinase